MPNNTWFSSCVIEKNDLFFFSDGDGFPIKYDIERKIISSLDNKNSIKTKCRGKAEAVFKYENLLINVDYSGTKIVIFSINDGKKEEIFINANYCKYDNFSFITIEGSNIYCFCRNKPKLIIFNIKERTVVERELKTKNKANYYCGMRKDDSIFLFPRNASHYLKYEVGNRKEEICEFVREFKNLLSVSIDESRIYLLEDDGHLLVQDIEKGTIIQKKIGEKLEYGRVCITDSHLILLPCLGENITICDKEFIHSEFFDEYPCDFQYRNEFFGRNKYSEPHEDGEAYYFGQREANYVLTIRKRDSFINFINVPDIVRKIQLKQSISINEKIEECKNKCLKDFLVVIQHDQIKNNY